MTNREWLGTLSPETWWEVVWNYVVHDYGARYTDTQNAVIDWLKQEHKPIEMWNMREQRMMLKWK